MEKCQDVPWGMWGKKGRPPPTPHSRTSLSPSLPHRLQDSGGVTLRMLVNLQEGPI